MTDRIHSITVVLREDMQVDDARQLIDCIRWMSGVAGVKENVTDVTSLMAEVRADAKWRDKLIALLRKDEP